ncbi:IclR family transcriptional regulator domain-containing protein [Microbacterium sp. B24]|uniref:IclR family transcriptional regulator domain-containing protein n=1 Tax=Microbacterium sp. B24 TaxID=95616 RepID=UPI0003F87CE8|nr:IclR family transcriptional regulator C-terminal domain-containing protein [Microbacterium sp. B24]
MRPTISSPDFIEALARGLDVIRAFGNVHRPMSLTEVAEAAALARPTARRALITLTELGYVRTDSGTFSLTPRVLELGMAYVASSDVWELTRGHLRDLVHATNESCSIAQLDGSDIVYVSRVAVPKLVTLSVTIGTRFPAAVTSLGKVLLASLSTDELEKTLATPSRSGIHPQVVLDREELNVALRDVRARGWALTDQQLAPAVRSVAAPIRNGEGTVVAAVNVNAHAMETSLKTLVDDYLPELLRAASAISADWALWDSRPLETLRPDAQRGASLPA